MSIIWKCYQTRLQEKNKNNPLDNCVPNFLQLFLFLEGE